MDAFSTVIKAADMHILQNQMLNSGTGNLPIMLLETKKEKKVPEDVGWHVIIVWECELKKEAEQTERPKKLAEEIKNNLHEGGFH